MGTTLAEFDYLGLDAETLRNPYPFFKLMREQQPVYREPRHGVYLVSRYDDIVSVARQPELFSSIVAATGPLTPLPERLEGETVSDQIARYREVGMMANSLLTRDPPDHTRFRTLVSKLFSPRRLREVEEYVTSVAHGLVDEFVDSGRVEFIDGFAGPFPFLVIADLLGVPREDHDEFKRRLRNDGEFRIGNPNADQTTMGGMASSEPSEAGGVSLQMMQHIYQYFSNYIQDRRDNPRDDIMTELAQSRFHDTGELPSVEDILGLAFILFGAGQETTVRLFTTGMQILLARPDVEQAIRDDRSLIPNFIEETLRYDTPVKGLFRVAREDAEVGGVPVPAGSVLMLLWGAGNRDPEEFADADGFDLGRSDAARTLSFGHGIHYCVGAQLARMEGRVGWNVLLDRLESFRLAQGHTDDAYLPSFIIRGLSELHLEFDAAKGRS